MVNHDSAADHRRTDPSGDLGHRIHSGRTLREQPEMYRKQLDLYARCDRIWITAGIPLLIPITIGFVAALCGISLVDSILSLII